MQATSCKLPCPALSCPALPCPATDTGCALQAIVLAPTEAHVSSAQLQAVLEAAYKTLRNRHVLMLCTAKLLPCPTGRACCLQPVREVRCHTFLPARMPDALQGSAPDAKACCCAGAGWCWGGKGRA